jgi:hypothetical protein
LAAHHASQILIYKFEQAFAMMFLVTSRTQKATSTTMGIKTFVVAALAALAVAKPIPDPLLVMRQAGPAAGQV